MRSPNFIVPTRIVVVLFYFILLLGIGNYASNKKVKNSGSKFLKEAIKLFHLKFQFHNENWKFKTQS